ncbi:subtilisin family serine protease [Lactobacillus colini]|uniref:Subtilisin family serine protease n=1 Tax=Lactobacillus colini TaxID=1819254 RepID=A0ABS4MCN4_9LACO|nr:S8 family serine peptidase [Lactobacillus colini]MBP2057091.1 subtilisin family serine protease [Lactobacillus colini]
MADFLKEDKLRYLNKSRSLLESNLSVPKSNKKVVATLATLASGVVILLSTPVAKADTISNTQVQNKTEQLQNKNQDQQNLISSVKPKDENDNNEGEEEQVEDEAGHKDSNGVEIAANNQDHLKGNVKSAWDQGYKGEHTAVAVIDSGVDVTHKDFQTMPKNPKLTAEEMKKKISNLGYGKYINEKFPYVYNAVDNENDNIKGPDDEPHGQHVSGIIAADGHPDGDKEYIIGVAPEAQLLHFKVFGDTTTSIDLAREIIDATNLGADVIQMSLGGGVAAKDLKDVDQKAVQYAIDHGVIVSISASNNGNAASVDDPSHLTNTDEYIAGGNAGNYQPFSSSTVADPGASQNAITVAAETSGLGKNSDMASFTSWGPLPDYTLKPDVSAPGSNVISTGNSDSYISMSGTSMAGPFVAGAAALVKQRLSKTNPELKGAKLVAAVKALLMNTAHPQTQNGYDVLVSPRRQGAGQIDVGAATAAPVYITASDGTSSVSLRNISESTNFDLTFHNLSDEAQSYSFDDFGGGFTEKREKDTGIFHDEQLAGAKVSGVTEFTVEPKKDKTINFKLNLTGLRKNQLVEGFLNFTNKVDKSTLVVPYLGYYGDMTSENVFDQNANDPKGADIKGNRFVNEDNFPRGIADEESLKSLVNIDSNYDWQQVAKLYETGKVAFSPNSDSRSDIIKPYAYLKQNLEDLKVEILNSDGKVVRVLADSHGVEKSYYEDGAGTAVDFGYSANNPDAFEWDGKLYDSKTGEMVTAPDGQYTYRFIATLVNDGPHKLQTNDTPVIIDTTAPVLSNITYDPINFTIKGNYKDQGAGFTDYSYATVTINDNVFGFKLNDGDSKFIDKDKTIGQFIFTLNDDEKAALSNADNKMTIAISDAADNTASQTISVSPVSNKRQVSIWNAINGLNFDKKSADYDAKTKTYLLRGNSKTDFYVNKKLVQVDDQGNFVFPVGSKDEKLVFSTDAAGKNVVGSFTTVTPKAKFAWQHVNGEDKSFGIPVYSIEGTDPNDIVVQAAVSKGENVHAFAKDYFEGTVYEGEVKDGVATFHVKTSINKDDKTGIFKRALLQGWTEITGPGFNNKQKTDPDPIEDANYIGIYYNPDATKHNPYTNRDDLGVENFKDENANPDDFKPGYYPGYEAPKEGSPDLTFDYLSDNNVSTLNQEAITNGWYDPKTHMFTLTGKANKNVKELIFLAHGLSENDPQNKVNIGKDGKFSVSFKIDDPATRQISYLYKTKGKGDSKEDSVTRGSMTLILDTIAPTLTINGLETKDGLEITTNKPMFKLSGEANDNLDGYSVFINGDNVFTQYGKSGYNYIPELATNGTVNNYGSYKFDREEVLNDQGKQPTTHIFTVSVVDQLGNKVEKKIIVHYDPNWLEKTDNVEQFNTGSESVTEPITKAINPVSPVSEQSKPVTVNDAQKVTSKKIELTHNSFIYDSEGNVIVQNNHTSSLKKGEKVIVLKNGKIFTIKGKQFYQIGSNSFIKVANTLPNKKILLTHNSFIYNSKGKVVLSHKKKHILLRKGEEIEALYNARVVTIKGKKFYQIDKNSFVKVANTLPNKKIELTHNSFVYDAKGKLVHKHGKHILLKRGETIAALYDGRIITINGKQFYQIDKDSFIKVANTLKFFKY